MQFSPKVDSKGPFMLISPDEGEDSFTIVRGAGAKPQGMFDPDSEVVCENHRGDFEDRRVLGGRDYYYAVEVPRKKAVDLYGPFSVHPGPLNVTATSMSGAVLVTCSLPPGCSSARVMRGEQGGTEVFFGPVDSGILCYEDRGAAIGVATTYSVTAVYKDGMSSQPVSVSGSPFRYIAPPEIKGATLSGGVATMRVASDEPADLFYTEVPLRFRGLRVDSSDLESRARHLASGIGGGAANFSVPQDVLWYIYPAIRSEGFYTLGKPYVMSTRPEPGLDVDSSNGRCTIRVLSVPDGAAGILVKAGTGSLLSDSPANAFDRYYDLSALEDAKRCISFSFEPAVAGSVKVFAAYKEPSGGLVYSGGVSRPLDSESYKISYSVSASGKGLRIDFKTDSPGLAVLPPVDVRAKSFNRYTGVVIAQSASVQMSGGMGSLNLDNDNGYRPSEIKVYFSDEGSSYTLAREGKL